MDLKRYMFIVLILLVCMVSISAVSAADDATDDIISADNEEIILDEAIDDDVSSTNDNYDDELILEDSADDLVGSENDNVPLKDGATGSFSDLNKLINEDYSSNNTITLNSNYKFTDGDDAYVHGIYIGRGVTIDGNGFTLDGSNSARMINVNTGSEVIIKNINFINGHATGENLVAIRSGGAIYLHPHCGNSKVINCNFTNNIAENRGGAIYVSDSNLEAINCTFIQNTAKSPYGGAMRGGTAINCTFFQNTAKYGGAIFLGTAYDCNFTGNTAKNQGGAMYDSTAYNCNFTDNTANEVGGAMSGGTAYNCNFTGNSAISYGGAIFNGTAVLCTFEDNDCYETTFAPFFDISEFITEVDSDEKLFFNLTYDGQVFTGLNTTMVVSNGVTATFVGDSEGYDIDWPLGVYKASLTLTDYPEVTGEITIKVTDGTTFSDLNKTINNNSDSLIVLDRNYTYNETVDGAFKDGVVISRALTIDGNGCTIDGLNTARIFNVSAGNVELSNITFKNGNSSKYGGAVYFFNGGSVIDCSFVSNYASIGGAVYFYEGNCAIYNSSFVNNSAGNFSALHLSFDDSEVHGCIFVNNTAQNGVVGQAWDSYRSMNITDNIFLKNNGNNAIDLADLGSFDISNNWFGSTAENYTVKPNDNVDKWLFLNGTADPNPMDILSTSDIIFKLSSYSISEGIDDAYDNSNLPIVNLSISKTNGEIKDSALLGEKLVFTPAGLGAATVTATIDDIQCTIGLDVDKVKTEITPNNPAIDLFVGDSSNIEYTLNPTDAVGDVTFTSSNPDVVTVDSTGQVKAIAEGKATITINFAGSTNYEASDATVNVVVSKKATSLTASAVTTTYNVAKDLVITLKDADGNPISGAKVTVDLNGAKNYTTDKNGQVKVAVGKLVPKTYTAKISFAGDDIYKASSTTAKVTVKKATPKLTSKAKTFKFEDKTKKYTVTLKDNKGNVLKNKKITLKVNGKTYTAKTNSKGVATFKLTKLNKKGKFSAVVTYAGDKYYNKVTKKPKITVKAPAWKTVSKGSKDKATVKKIQKALKDNGYYLTYKGHYLKIDGIYDSCTVRSVKQFQKAKKLQVTGKVDYATAKKLKLVS